MNNIIFLSLFIVLFSGCISSTPSIAVDETKEVKNKNKKSFEQEDALIMFALRAEQLKDYRSAEAIFDDIYLRSQNKEYLYRSLHNALFIKNYNEVIKRVDEVSANSLDDYALVRLKIIALVQLSRLEEAEQLAVSLVEKSKEVDDYILANDIYVKQKKFNTAVKYLESAYLQNYNEKILDRISIVLYVNLNRKKDAIAQLETHTRVHGCSALICKRLIAFYSNENSVDGLLSTYLRLYKVDSSPEVSKKIIQIYGYKREYAKLILFLEDNSADDETLFQLYVSSKDYKKASVLAQKIYDKSGKISYLGDSAIYQYESQEDKNNKEILKIISKKFEEVLQEDRSTLYLNYYGYLLIDHDLNVKKGLTYIKEALESEPNSVFYLDSLAWGYYKQGRCKESLSIIERVITLDGGDDPEVLKHHKIIKNCKGKK